MDIKFSDVLDLFELINFGSQFDHEGYICKASGKTYFHSEFGDNEEELPNDITDERYLVIPHKNELNLGINLAFDFIQEYLPKEFEKVRSIFYRKGAYAKFKSLLESTGKIEEWYKFEAKRTEQALREWCAEQDVEISS
jgi:hypothetical protein